MTGDQFERLVCETRIAGAAGLAARMVLVDGMTQELAGSACSVDQSAVCRAVARVRAVESELRELVRERLLWCAGAVRDFPELVSESGKSQRGGEFSALLSDAIAAFDDSIDR